MWAIRQSGAAFPFGTLIVIVGECFLLGAAIKATLYVLLTGSASLLAGLLGAWVGRRLHGSRRSAR